MEANAQTYAEMHNTMTELMRTNENLRREVAELQAGQKLLQLKNEELLIEIKSSRLKTTIVNASVPKDGNVATIVTQNNNQNPNNIVTQKVYKPPPIIIKGVKHFDKLRQILTCEEPIGHEQKFKVMSNEETKILTTNENQFRSTIKILEENNIEYHRYQLKSEKPFRVVLRGINHDSDLGMIKNELYDQGHEVIQITNIQIKKKTDPKNKNSEWTHIRLPLFFVDLQPRENNKEIYNIKLLCHQVIKIEPPRKKKEVPQCKNCQAIGHTQNYCHRSAVCVKCGEGHSTIDCTKPKKIKAKCANCGENHTANWKGCSVYKKAIERAHPKQVSAVQRIQQKPAQPVTANISYAQIASTSSTPRDNQVAPQMSIQQPKENADSRLNEILAALTNVTQALSNITTRLDKLETKQTKSKNTKQKKK